MFTVNFQWLDTTLQARGYGILGFSAMAASIATWRHLEDGRIRWLVGLIAVSVIGVWTVPSFAFLAGPLWLLLVVVRRDRSVVLAAVGAGVAVLALLRTAPGRSLEPDQRATPTSSATSTAPCSPRSGRSATSCGSATGRAP